MLLCWLFFSSVPLPPANFTITREYHTTSNITVTFEWDPPQGNGPEVTVDSYEISVTPSPLFHSTPITINSTVWNATLNFNTVYVATIISINCAGAGKPLTLQNIEFSKLAGYKLLISVIMYVCM